MAHATATFQLSHMRHQHKEEQVEGRNGSERAKGGVDQGVALSEQIGRQDDIRQEATVPANAVNVYDAKRQTEAAKQCVSKIPLPPVLEKPTVGSTSTQIHRGHGHQARVAALELKEWHR